MTAKLEARNVRLAYSQTQSNTPLSVLENVDLRIEDGEFVSIVGPSGCGKTSFLYAVDGLLPIASGEILVDGVPVTKPGVDRALVFQDASLLPWRTVLGNVAFGLECLGVGAKEARGRARGHIELVGLKGFENSFPHELSGGMQQRVNLARALVVDPQVLLMDEPFAALDAQTRGQMQEELLRVWRQSKKTVLFITHQIDEAIFLSDRVAVFAGRPGRVRDIVPIDFERPRSLALKRDPAFHRHEDHIGSMIMDQSRSRDDGANAERSALSSVQIEGPVSMGSAS